MARLHEGWRRTKEKEQEARDAEQGNDSSTHDYGPNSPRESDWDAYHDFRERHGIESNGEAAA